MATGFKFGPTTASMKANGKITRHLGRGSSIILMETHTKETGATTRQMEKAHTRIRMGQSTSGNGKMTNNMGREWRSGWTGKSMKEITRTAPKLAQAL